MPQANLNDTTSEGQDGQSHDFVLRIIVEDGTRNKYGKARTSCVITSPNSADVGSDDLPRDDKPSTPDGVRISAQETLFLRCILKCQAELGEKPSAELGLGPRIGIVVDYDYVKRLMFTKMLRDDDNTEEGRKRHRERTKTAIKSARQRLMHLRVTYATDYERTIGRDPSFWRFKPMRTVSFLPGTF